MRVPALSLVTPLLKHADTGVCSQFSRQPRPRHTAVTPLSRCRARPAGSAFLAQRRLEQLPHCFSPAGLGGHHGLAVASQQRRLPSWDSFTAPVQVKLLDLQVSKESGRQRTVGRGHSSSGVTPLLSDFFQVTAPVSTPRSSPSLSAALWGGPQGPVSGFLSTASRRAGEVTCWGRSLPSTILPLLCSFLPQPFA